MICRVCGSEMTLDALVADDARRSLDPDIPAPVVMKCGNGHSERLDAGTVTSAVPPTRPPLRCAVCGVEIPRQRGAAPRKSCGPEHKRFIEVKRAEAVKLHRATGDGPFHFVVEAQDWYRGAATVFRPRARRPGPSLPTAVPADWLQGFRRIYPVLEVPAAAVPSTFPPLDEELDASALVFKTRRYRRKHGPRPALARSAAPVAPGSAVES